ncbi:hypothetical protein QYF36_012657 [Acer negundo]|nr:hypothetical protein QYF36_012657 [Acer negundo]
MLSFDMGFLFQYVQSPASMEILLDSVIVVFSISLLTWLLIEIFKRRTTDYGDLQMGYRVRVVSVVCNFFVAITYLGFGVYDYWKLRIISYKSVFYVMTWVLATVVVAICSKNTTHRDVKRWPLVLILWWIFSFTIDLLSVSFYLLNHLGSIKLPHFLPEATVVDFVAFPLLIVLLCLSALPLSYNKKYSEFESPLLQKEDDKSSKDGSYSISNAGVWSKLTFGWLNPLFAKGRVEKVELKDIPSIPHSETAESASLLLEKSVREHNMVSLSLKQVVAYTIWKSLAINAVFAVSFDRIQEFIREEDQMKPIPDHASTSSDISVDIEVGDYAWETSDQKSQNSTIIITERLKIMKGYKVMKDGKIVQSGKFEDLSADPNGELVKQMTAHRKSLNQVKPPQEENSLPCQISQIEVTEETFSRPISHVEFSERIQEEEAETGRVRWSVYSTFITSVHKGALIPVILLCHVFFQGLQMSSNYWIAWAAEEKRNVSSVQLIGVFVLLSSGSSAFILGRAVLLTTIAIKTAQRLFNDTITSVFRAPISFFDSTPSSQILNRSSSDQSTVDTDIPYRLAGLVFALIQLLSIIFLMSEVAWQAYYISTARELARMVGIRKAPILHHFSESISGAVTIRCFNQEDRFLRRTLSVIDDYSRIAFHNSGTMEWLSVRTNFLFNIVFLIVLIILVTLPRSAIDPSMAGLVATYGLNLNVLQAWVIWNLCNVENKMISVERILQFTKLPSEAPLVIKESRPNSDWPTDGKIELENLQVQYTPALPMVLKGITCIFPGEKKIGVVGRTGTVKTNLDPLEQHSDQEIWEVVNKCRLAEIIRKDRRLLDAPVAEDGENLSLGQRQLVCLARVLLKKRRILVLDEATASIDTATDNVIQQTIREETNRCTVITVAHRIPTVIDNDLVLVLDEGKIVEYDSPRKLLEDNTSSFSKLAYYISTARELARMVGIRKAPILHHFSESISGAATIRCFNQEDRFLRRSLCVIDDYSRIAFHNNGTMEQWNGSHIQSLDQVKPPQEDNSSEIQQIEVTEEDFSRPISPVEFTERIQEEEAETGQYYLQSPPSMEMLLDSVNVAFSLRLVIDMASDRNFEETYVGPQVTVICKWIIE